jgi:RimJ/RimL family protein N-acetyltransferase
MFRFTPGKVVEQFEAGDNLITLRFPKMADARSAMANINALIAENARIFLRRKVNLTEERKWLRGVIRDIKQDMKIMFVIDVRGRFIGSTVLVRRLRRPSAFDHIAEFAIGLARRHRQCGIGEHAARTLFNLGKALWRLKLIRSSYAADNTASAALHKKLGFKIAGRIPKGAKYGNRYIDEIVAVKELK